MNWKEFKRQVEAAGVTDETIMDWIDTSGDLGDDKLRVLVIENYFTVSN